MSSELSNTRSYHLRRRAEQQEQTRQRIIEAAVALHTTLGPAHTSVQAIADRAGVTRPTVYAHFPDARSLLMACSGHVAAADPPPDASAWQDIADPARRLAAALSAVYAYYGRHEQLLDNVQRDVTMLPALAEISEYRSRYLRTAREALVEAWPARGAARSRLRRAIGHALEFRTWQSLVRRQGCSVREAVALMTALAEAASSGRAPAPPRQS
jgi:AcrR family transcriptional regulator